MAAPAQQTGSDGKAGQGRYTREIAQRVFAAEYVASTLEYKEGGERSPSFVVTPLGTRINRLFFVGVLTQNENVGASGDMWRAQIMDPTGVFHVSAGQYQPEAASALAELKPPCVVAVVGKSRTWTNDEGQVFTSVRPEEIREVSVDERDRWVVETARHTLERLEALQEALKLGTPTAADLRKLDIREDLAEGIERMLQSDHYERPDLEKWAHTVRDALEYVLPGGGAESVDFAPATQSRPTGQQAAQKAPAATAQGTNEVPTNTVTPSAPATESATPASEPAAEAKSDGDQETEDYIFQLTEKLDDGKGAPWEDIVAAAGEKNIGEDQVEEALNNLMDKGLIYEPVLGRLKRA